MSSKTTIIWLLVAVALGAAALLVLRSPGRSAALTVGDRLLSLEPSTVESVLIRHPDGGTEQLARSGALEWTMTVTPAGAAPDSSRPAWPVVSPRMQSLLRHVADAAIRAIPDSAAAAGPRSTIVEFRFVGGKGPLTLRLSDQSVAGKALVEVDDPSGIASTGTSSRPLRAVIDDALHLLFRDHAPREWRDRQALYGLEADASRIALDNDRGVHLSLGRVDGQWSVREPVSAPADPNVVQRLLGSLASVQIVDFLDQGVAAATTGLQKPAAIAVVEADRREGPIANDQPGAMVTDRRRLELGGAADAAGTRLFARIDDERTVVIDARTVADLRLEPTTFLWPHPTRLNQADIGTIALDPSAAGTGATYESGGVVFKRQLDKWLQIRPDGQEVQLPAVDTHPVEALLAFLCGPTPEAAALAKSPPPGPTSISVTAPANLKPAGKIALLSLSGAPLDSLEVGSPQFGLVTIRTGPVYRTWALDRVPSRIADLVHALNAPPSPPTGPEAPVTPTK